MGSNSTHGVGALERLVLAALLQLKNKAYGVLIIEEIEKRTGREYSIGAIYTTLDRLEKKGFVSSYRGESTPERGGRAKRYFQLEGLGVSALRDGETAMSKMLDGLDFGLGAL